MKAKLFKTISCLAMCALGVPACFAQDWMQECIDPANTNPISPDYGINQIENSLMLASMGVSGTVGFGDADNSGTPCYATVQNLAAVGRFCFAIGSTGSVQRSSQNFEDGGMTLTKGAPNAPIGNYCFANSSVDGVQTFFGANGLSEAFRGFSNRYLSGTSTNGIARIKCQIEVVGDAARMRWTMTNTDTAASHAIGLWFGATPSMLSAGQSNSESGGVTWSHSGMPAPLLSGRGRKRGFVYSAIGRPPHLDVKFDKTLRPTEFPSYVNFLFGQTDAFGMRIENSESQATHDDDPRNAPTDADKFTLGKEPFLLGAVAAAAPSFSPDNLLPDTDFTGSTAFVQQFPEQVVPPLGTRQILHYIRSPWSEGSYSLPYGVVVDAPRSLSVSPTDFDGNPTDGGLLPNPFTIRVYVDNVGGFGFDGREFPLSDVKIQLAFGANSNFTILGSNRQNILSVDARQLKFIDFRVRANDDAVGVVPYTITVDSQPGSVHKVVNGSITVAGRPRITLHKDANFVSVPYSFLDSSLAAVFENFIDPIIPGGEVQGYVYDPQQKGYQHALGVERGKAMWVLYNQNTPLIANLMGTPSIPTNFLDSAPVVRLKAGWNQIGNPYNYAFPINQIVGVSASNPGSSYTWGDIVSLGYVSNFLASYDATTGDYNYIDGGQGSMEPNKGYWLFVQTATDLSLNYPPIFAEFTPGMSRIGNGVTDKPLSTPWQQSANRWRLKLVARSGNEQDVENYIGIAETQKAANALRVMEPPIAPEKGIGLSIASTVNGESTRLSQDILPKSSRREWTAVVDVVTPGQVTVTWPNMSTLPRNLRVKVKDLANGVTRDLRQTSGYSFTAERTGHREFRITVEEGGVSRAVIGNVVVSQPGRATDKGAPITINYTLSSDSTTSVRILGGNGREVYVASRGRADRAGDNTITWTLRDQSNRAVAPGSYRVEIIAETASGERVRKIVPVTVIR